ncbi:MAG: radical SAM protein [Planctomycetes bacterium]|nr:radical SAM protein [Planctomycetota bacterium]
MCSGKRQMGNSEMNLIERIQRHIRLSVQAGSDGRMKTPPFLILFINSVCNLKCGHCFYWRSLNKEDDLTFDEIIAFAKDYGSFENLNLSGGEPFIRKELGGICRFFIHNNQVKQIYIPTNAYFPDKMQRHIEEILKEPALQLLVIEISLDGMAEYHNNLRGDSKSFQKAMESYTMLEGIQKKDKRLRIHSISTVTSDNIAEIRRLTDFLYNQCPSMDHHNIAMVRGDRKNQTLETPQLEAYRDLWKHVDVLWKDREKGRFGAIVEPMLQWAKGKITLQQQQVIPCLAGILSAVVYANGDVSFCEFSKPSGNLRKRGFFEIWHSPEAEQLRRDIKKKRCYCTNEIFLWPSIVFQPFQLMRAMIGGNIWKKY